MRKKITKRSVDALRAATRPDGRRRADYLWDTEVTGFGCKMAPTGHKVYVFQYRTRSQSRKTAPKRLTLAKHGELTPDEAREIASKLLLEVRAGGDPAKAWLRLDPPTMEDLERRFLTKYLPGKKRPPRRSTVAFYEVIFRKHIRPAFGRRHVVDIKPADVERLHNAMGSIPYLANRTLSLLQNAFDQAERWGWRPQGTNPARHLDRYPEAKRGERKEVMLDASQMARLLAAIAKEEDEGTDPIACAAIRVAFWTGWRIGEVLRLEWNNIDLESGIAKLLRTKTSDEEYRQLPHEAVSVLRKTPRLVGCPYVFPGASLEGHLTTVRKPWVSIRERAELDDLSGLGPLRLHDLRHNVVSWDVSRGVPLEIAGRNVGHRSRRSTEVYAHFAPDALKLAVDGRAEAMRGAIDKARSQAKKLPRHPTLRRVK